MGSNQGVVWNDSDLPLQYVVYGAFEEVGSSKNTTTLSPRLDLSIPNGLVSLDGFHSVTEF